MQKYEDDLASSIKQIIDDETHDASMYVDSRSEFDDDDFDFEDDEPVVTKRPISAKEAKKLNMITAICIVCVVIVFATVSLALIMIIKNKTTSTYTYNYDKAKQYYTDKNYDKAIEYFSYSLDSMERKDNAKIIEINMYLYDCYKELNQINGEIEALNGVLDVDKFNTAAIKAIAKLYYEAGNGVEINRMISAYKDTACYGCVSEYVIPAPIVNYGGGSYEENVVITVISDNPELKVYYTLDGSTPTVYATPYEEPFELGSGENELKLIAISPIGVKSEVVTQNYDIKYGKPAKPIASVTSGTYTEAKTIEITNIPTDATCYYTWDGSVPTTSSEKYDPEKKIEMIIGNNVLSLIIVSKYEQTSAVSKYMYVLNLAAKYDYTAAYDALSQKLKETKVLKSDGFLATGEECRFVYYSMVKIDEKKDDKKDDKATSKYIYLIYFDILKNGNYDRQSFYYGVDSNTLDLYKVEKDETQNYVLSPLK